VRGETGISPEIFLAGHQKAGQEFSRRIASGRRIGIKQRTCPGQVEVGNQSFVFFGEAFAPNMIDNFVDAKCHAFKFFFHNYTLSIYEETLHFSF